MNWFKKIFSHSKPIETKDIQKKPQYKSTEFNPPWANDFYNQYYSGSRLTATQAINYYISNPAVYTCVDLISTTVEQMRPCLLVDGEYIYDHPLIYLLNNPNGFESWDEFIAKVSRYLSITGNTYLTCIGNYKYPPLELYSINPANISIISNIDSYPDSFYLSSTGFDGSYERIIKRGDITRFIKDIMTELYQIKKFGSNFDNLQGDSPLNSISGILEQLNNGIKHNTKQLENGVNIPAWLNFRDNPDQEELDNRRKFVLEQLTGADNAGHLLVTGSDGRDQGTGVDFYQWNSSNRDMQFEQLIKQGNLAVYNSYHIPIPFITTEGATFSNIEKSVYRYYEDVGTPHANILFSGFSKLLIPKYNDLKGTDAQITFNPYDIPALKDKLVDVLFNRKKVGIETINELRSELPNKKPIKGGDDITFPGTTITLSELETTDRSNDRNEPDSIENSEQNNINRSK